MRNWNDHISDSLQKYGYRDYSSLNVFGFITGFKNYDDDMFSWKEQGLSPEEIADKKLSLLKEEISEKYRFLSECIWKPTLSENFVKSEHLFSYNKLLTDAAGYIRWLEYQERLASRTHNESSYTSTRNRIVRNFLEDITVICRRMLNGLQRFENRPNIYAESSLDVRASIEARYVNPLLDYGTSDAEDSPFAKSADSDVIVNPDIRIFHYGEIYKYYNDRVEQAKYNAKLVEKRKQMKTDAARRYSDMLPAFSLSAEDIIDIIKIQKDDMENVTQERLDYMEQCMHRNLFSVLFEKAYRYMDVLDVIIPLNFQINDCLYDAQMMLKAEQDLHYHPQRPVDPMLVEKFRMVVGFYTEMLDIVDSFKDGYSEWARHHMNEYGEKWFGRFLDVYGGKNPLNIDYDYSTYEICYFENGWNKFWSKYSFKMSEP
jgi:hypothetical protein